MARGRKKNPFLKDVALEEVRVIRRRVLDRSGAQPELRRPDVEDAPGRTAEGVQRITRGNRRAKTER